MMDFQDGAAPAQKRSCPPCYQSERCAADKVCLHNIPMIKALPRGLSNDNGPAWMQGQKPENAE